MSQKSHVQEKLAVAADVGSGSAESDGESDLRSWDGDVTAHLFERSRIRALAGESLVVVLCTLPSHSRAAHCQSPIDPLSLSLSLSLCYALATRGRRHGSRLLCMTAPTDAWHAAALLPLVWEAAHFCPSVSVSISVLRLSKSLVLCLCRPFRFRSTHTRTWERGAARFNGCESQLKSQVNSRVILGTGPLSPHSASFARAQTQFRYALISFPI